jgi:hypothetical protein
MDQAALLQIPGGGFKDLFINIPRANDLRPGEALSEWVFHFGVVERGDWLQDRTLLDVGRVVIRVPARAGIFDLDARGDCSTACRFFVDLLWFFLRQVQCDQLKVIRDK